MVSNSALAALCVHSGLSNYLIYNSPSLEADIKDYRIRLQDALQREEEDASAEGRGLGQYWNEIEPPKVCIKLTANLS
jgi:endoribonuclease Dicer